MSLSQPTAQAGCTSWNEHRDGKEALCVLLGFIVVTCLCFVFLQVEALMNSLCFEYPPSASQRTFQDTNPESKILLFPASASAGPSNVIATRGSAPWRAHPWDIKEGALSLQHIGTAQSSCWKLYQAGGISLGFLRSKGRAFQRDSLTEVTRL